MPKPRSAAKPNAPPEIAGTDPDDVAERILDAARDHFAAVGLRHTSMEDVAKRANLSRITVYRRFASKPELVQAVLLREVRTGLAEVEHGLEHLSMEDGLVEGFVRTLRIIRAHPLVTRLLEMEPELSLPFATLNAAPFMTVATHFLASRLRHANRDLDRTDALTLSELLVRMTISFVLTPKAAIDLEGEPKIREFAARYIVGLVRAFGVKA